MKKIVFLVANIYKGGGVQRVVSILANKLHQKEKYDVTILSLFKTGDSPAYELNCNINVENVYTDTFDLRIGYWKAVRGLKKVISNKNIDIFITAGMGYVPISSCALLGKEIRHIAWEHQNFHFGRRFGLDWWGKRIARKKADCIIVLTKQDLMQYKDNFKHIKNIKQIYNPCEIKGTSIEYKRDTKKIISCGSLSSQKGFDILIEVANYLSKKHLDWEWHIWGDGPDKNILLEKVKEYNLEEKIIFKGYTNDVYSQYKNYSLYVMTSRHEGFPMVLIEAKSNKLPIVSFDCKCGPRELVKDCLNGYIIEPFNIEEMGEKIKSLLEDENKLEQFSNNSLIGIKILDEEKIIKQWEEMLDNIDRD